MNKFLAIASVAALGLGAQTGALAYDATAAVTLNFGGNAAGAGANTDVGWTSSGVNTIASVANSNYFTTLAGYNSQTYYNQDFASAAQCAAGAGIVPASFTGTVTTRKYGCRYTSTGGTPLFAGTPVVDTGPNNGRATGTLTVTDTTMTGTLNLVTTTDEPTGATTVFSSGVRLSNSVGNGLDGYNLRGADGSPFGNNWNGTTTAGTLNFALTGTFTASSWNITGGTVKFADSGFACQQGGFGGDGRGTLCTQSVVAGGFQVDGGALSWGWDLNGDSAGTAVTMLEVRDAGGVNVLSTLSGVLASMSIAGGNLTTNTGEFRRGLGSSGGGCADHIRFDGTKIACGSLTTGLFNMTGSVSETVIPAPAAVWLLGTGIGALVLRRKLKK